MTVFWQRGFNATTLDDLVKTTGVSRHGIYEDFGGKDGLFLASLEVYQREVVTPAFAQVEVDGAGLTAVASYLRQQIDRADAAGLPGPGCLFANTMTEIAPHNARIRGLIDAHNQRLMRGFSRVLRHESAATDDALADELAHCMTVFTNGLWSSSRVSRDARALHACAAMFIDMVAARLGS